MLPLLARQHLYTVKTVRRLNEEVLEIALTPRRRRVAFVPGQFVFVTFYGDGIPHEAHPFTICTVPKQKEMALTVKVAGDFTDLLYRQLHSGMSAKVEGPYGRFDYRAGSRRQVWLAGGVGVVPFLSWARYMAHTHDQDHQITFYYCVHSRSDAVHYQEFARLAAQLDNLNVKLVCSEEKRHLRVADIGEVKDQDVFMCGPKRFTSDLERQFRERGVPGERIYFEDFEFR
jgi:predicted ferric reductase